MRLSTSARLAAVLGMVADGSMADVENVSTRVAFHTSDLP